MPLRRLSIQAAVHNGRRHVSCAKRADGWAVTWTYPDGSPGDNYYLFSDQRTAIKMTRELRIFVTLLALGIESNEALLFATEAAARPGAIADLVAGFMRRK